MAALTKDGKTLTIGIVNPTKSHVQIRLDLKGIKITGQGRRYEVTGSDPMAYNEPGKPPRVRIEEKPVTNYSDKLPVVPYSVKLYVLAVQ